jgi:2-amino-4-hydroxy-6-hydroxymethyldihydropteridine diphosphokinase
MGYRSRRGGTLPVRTFIGLGANLGDARATFVRALAELRLLGTVTRTSSLYLSAPRDVVEQPDFLNAAIEILSELEPRALIGSLHELEKGLGREPEGPRFGPRTIDLDILAMDGRCVEDLEVGLIVPHPRLHERRFALEPLAELDPNLRPWRDCADLRADVTVADLLPTVADQVVQRIAGPAWADERPKGDGTTPLE